MLILCAGYSYLYHSIITRQGNGGTTPDSWLRLLHRRQPHDSPGITKISGLHMPPHFMIALHGLPSHSQQGVLSHLLALAQSRRVEDRQRAPNYTTTEPNLLKKTILRELKNELRRLLTYHNSKYSADDPPHVMEAQDHTSARLCSLVKPTTMAET